MRSHSQSKPKARKPRAIDLFAGAGGLTLGLRLAGFKVVGAVESDSLCCKTYKSNNPNVRLWSEDIRNITGPQILQRLRIKRGRLELLAACPPCQGFSTMRTKNGRRRNRDSRNGLLLDVLRLVRSIQPKAIMLENVPGLERTALFREFARSLRSLGYKTDSRVLNTIEFDVPQNRRRLVLVAARIQPQLARAKTTRRTVRHALKYIVARNKRDALHDYSPNLTAKVKRLIGRIPKDGGSRSDLGKRSQLRCHRNTQGFFDVYGRMAWDSAAPTITGGCINPSKGRFLHPKSNRPITLREAALLQTFPVNYKFCLDRGRYAVALMIGNALPPLFIRAHASALLKSSLSA